MGLKSEGVLLNICSGLYPLRRHNIKFAQRNKNEIILVLDFAAFLFS